MTEPCKPLGPVRRLAAEVIAPCHFFVGPALSLQWEYAAAEESAWEIFQGRLLDPAHTRERCTFEAWNVYAQTPDGLAAEALLALKLDAAARLLHVVRGVENYVWEGYDAGGNVILSRERRKWVRELVGTIRLDDFTEEEALRDELTGLLFRAVVGSSRLPLTPVEAPLPAFSFGELFYGYRPDAAADDGPLRSWQGLVSHLLTPAMAGLERAKLLEFFLRAVPESDFATAVAGFIARWAVLGLTGLDLVAVLRTLFNEVSLSPYTNLVDRALRFLRALDNRGTLAEGQAADFLGWLLRHVGRHLTAYDLVTFHHRGANYPDALLLDAVLKDYLSRIEQRPDLFADLPGEDDASRRGKRLRRRALRQGYLLRRRYEGHPVPEMPTSPGESMRVLPPSHPRVPEEQILQPAKRPRRLFADDPLPAHLGPHAADVLRESIADLEHASELRELGMALFLDRPFGTAKAPTEPDATLLLACEAFSPSLAAERLRQLARDPGLPDDSLPRWQEHLSAVRGLSLDAVGGASRPGSVALVDARRAAPDFVFLRTTPGSVATLLEQFDFTPLACRFDLGFLTARRRVLLARAVSGSSVILYDEHFRPRIEMDVQGGYARRGGREYPADGLVVLCVWEEGEGTGPPRAHDLRAQPIRLPPRVTGPIRP